MKLKAVFAGSLAALALAGCAKDTPAGHAADQIDRANQEAELRAHKYVSKCDTSSLIWKLGGANSQNTLYDFSVSSGDAAKTIQYFGSGDCTGALVAQATYTGTQIIGNEIADGSARILDLNYMKVAVTISSPDLVKALNSILVPSCDIHDWAVGAARDVTTSAGGATCLAVPKPAQAFDIVHTDGQTTFFGDKSLAGHDGLTPEARPTQLDKGNSYSKM